MSTIQAPWTPTQVAALNRFQHVGIMHPFTCAEHSSLPLTATADGWTCEAAGCDYTQKWADAIMADSDWLDEALERRRAWFAKSRLGVDEGPNEEPETLRRPWRR